MSLEADIFRKGSTTYYWSSVFFPRHVRQDVFRLYSFVRVVDDLVDSVPPNAAGFQAIAQGWQQRKPLGDSSVADAVLANILELTAQYGFEPDWVDDFMSSMRWDIEKREYRTLADSLEYVYGSAEVIGLMMARILDLGPEAYEGARLQGRAMQWINFCRDVQEDVNLGRCYFPREELDAFGLPDLRTQTASSNRSAFTAFMHHQLDRYDTWQRDADQAYRYIPRRLRVPIGTASSMYNWTARQIRQDPFIVYSTKVKPTKWRIVRTAVLRGAHG